MSDLEPCRTETLAYADGFRVDRCSCGAMHLHAGDVTLRMPTEAAEQFAIVLNDAIALQRERDVPARQPTLRLVEALGAPLSEVSESPRCP